MEIQIKLLEKKVGFFEDKISILILVKNSAVFSLILCCIYFVKCQCFGSLNFLCTGGHRTRVAAVTLDNMAEDAVAASASLRQILTVSVRYCGPALVSWLSMLWDTLMRNSELQWFDISPQFHLKVSRGDEGVGHVCFPGDEGVGQPWRGYRYVQMNVGPAWYLELLLNLVLCIYFWIQNPI